MFSAMPTPVRVFYETGAGKEFMKIFREMKGLPQEEDKEALMPDDTEKDKKDSKAAFVSDDMFED